MDPDDLEELLRRVNKEIAVRRAYQQSLRAEQRADEAHRRFVDARLAAAVRSRMVSGESLDEIAAECGASVEEILALL